MSIALPILAIWQSLNTLPDCQNLPETTNGDSGNLAIWQPFNTLPDCQNNDLPESTPYDPALESFAEWLERADRVLDQYYPSFHDRVELAWDTIDDWLQRASMPNDPLGLEPHEVEAIRLLLAFAEARGFPHAPRVWLHDSSWTRRLAERAA
jgi:hypothetical protein